MDFKEPLWRAYLAGLFDGEGCVTLCKGSGSWKQVRVLIGQKNQFELLGRIHQHYGGIIQLDKTNLGMARWQVINKEQCKRFLEDVLPYVQHTAKRKKAEVALAILSLTCEQGQKMTDRDTLHRAALEDAFDSLRDTAWRRD